MSLLWGLKCVFLSHSGFLSGEWVRGTRMPALLLPLGAHNGYRASSAVVPILGDLRERPE